MLKWTCLPKAHAPLLIHALPTQGPGIPAQAVWNLLPGAIEGTSCVCSLEDGLLCAMHVHTAGAALFPCSQDFSFLGLETQDRLMIITGLKGM